MKRRDRAAGRTVKSGHELPPTVYRRIGDRLIGDVGWLAAADEDGMMVAAPGVDRWRRLFLPSISGFTVPYAQTQTAQP
jgi:hypothetical protein